MAESLNVITRFYLKSHRFNGYPFANLQQEIGMEFCDAFSFLKDNVDKGILTVVFGDIHPNPHIKGFSDEPKEKVLKKLDKYKANLSGCYHTCLYPTKLHLESTVNSEDYKDCPYTLEMALGAGQLEFRYFELTVLEFYRNDPRYYYRCDDINGRISIHDEYYDDNSMHEKDKILLDTFGFGYNKDMHRAVTTFVYDLSQLSPEHQQVWKHRELDLTEYNPHPDYFRNNVLGEWSEKTPICKAFLVELNIINQMCSAMGKPALFRKDFVADEKPREFSLLVRPTHKDYYHFVGLLDKMMSDNINKKFFEKDISCEQEETRSDGKVIVKQKGTIRLLEEWLRKHYRSHDMKLLDDIFKAFRKVRKQRQRPAHSIDDNTFDNKFFADQREIMNEAYNAIRTIRLVLANHPAVMTANIDIPKSIFEGEICSY